jgi:hypothetical protein
VSLTRRLRSALNRRAWIDPARVGVEERDERTGEQADPIEGVDPSGEVVSVQVREGTTVLLFLTSSCRPCLPLWAGPPADHTIYVTPSPATESRRRVGQLARPGQVVVMSSDAWHAYGVRRAPWMVVVEEGVIAVDSPAPSPPGPIGRGAASPTPPAGRPPS